VFRRLALAAVAAPAAAGRAAAHDGTHTPTPSGGAVSAVSGAEPSLLLAVVGGALTVGWGAAYAREAVADRVAAAGVLVGLIVLLVGALS